MSKPLILTSRELTLLHDILTIRIMQIDDYCTFHGETAFADSERTRRPIIVLMLAKVKKSMHGDAEQLPLDTALTPCDTTVDSSRGGAEQ